MSWIVLGLMWCAIILANTAVFATDTLRVRTKQAFEDLPLSFEPNVGQLDDNVRFFSHGSSYSVFLTQDEVVLGFPPTEASTTDSHSQLMRPIHMRFLGADRGLTIVGNGQAPGRVNYFRGNDPRKWKTSIPTYKQVRYRGIYNGIDLVFYERSMKLEYDFIVNAGADPNAIRVAIAGADSAILEPNGDLRLKVGKEEIRFRAPSIYQPSAHGQRRIEGSYSLLSPRAPGAGTTIGFKIRPYNHNLPLVIDPVLDYSTYLGGIGGDWASGVAVDAARETYVVGTTSSFDFPTTPGSVFPNHAPCGSGYCRDVFITKFNAKGNALIYSTYLGGSNDDYGYAIAVDTSGNAYVTGSTQSTDFPTTGGALQRSCGGTCFYNDAFVTKLDPTGSLLVYSTYLGGSNEDDGTGISVQNGNAYVSGFSGSTDFPTTPGAYQRQLQGQGSSFVVQLNAKGTALNYGTFIGEVDLFGAGPGIAVDSGGNSYLAGTTLSSNFPLTQGAFHTPFQQGLVSNLYITKLNAAGSALVYSAMLGGVFGSSIAIDVAGSSYIAGAAGTFYPITPGALNPTCDSGTLVAKLSPDGSQLQSAALVCSESGYTSSLSRDAAGNIVLAGDTASPFMPTTVGAFQTSIANGCCFSDAFVAKLTADFGALAYSTYFGGNASEYAGGAVLDSAGNLYLVGSTSSTNLPVKNAFQPSYGGNGDAFVSKFTLPKTSLSIYPAVLNFTSYGLGVSSAPLQVTVANLSRSTLSISSIATSGDFSQTNNCGSQLLRGSQCTVQILFKPVQVGSRTGNLTLTDSSGTQTVTLSGIGVNGPLVAFSPNYQVLNQPLGYTSPPLTIVVSNPGNNNLNISQISLQGGAAWNFYGNTNCFNPVKPNGSCRLQVDYTPTYNCTDYSDLQLVDNASNSPQNFGLVGQCGAASLDFSSSGLRFDPVKVGAQSASKSVAVVNGFSSALNISNIVASVNFAQTNNCPATLNPGGYCYVKVSSAPSQIGIVQGSMTVTDSSKNTYTLPLLGTGSSK